MGLIEDSIVLRAGAVLQRCEVDLGLKITNESCWVIRFIFADCQSVLRAIRFIFADCQPILVVVRLIFAECEAFLGVIRFMCADVQLVLGLKDLCSQTLD
jgi:hypothetical protein